MQLLLHVTRTFIRTEQNGRHVRGDTHFKDNTRKMFEQRMQRPAVLSVDAWGRSLVVTK